MDLLILTPEGYLVNWVNKMRHDTGWGALCSGLTAGGGLPCFRHQPQGLGKDPGKIATEPWNAVHANPPFLEFLE